MTKISVVIPTFNRREFLEKCLANLCEQNLDPEFYEIIVADDENSPETHSLVFQFKKSHPQHRFMYVANITENPGPAAARNCGWKKAHGEIIAFTDDDCLPRTDWLSNALREFDEETDAVWGKVIVPLRKNPTDYELNTANLGRHEFVTANCFCRKEILEKIGGFDERFYRPRREDSDLYFSFIEQKVRIRFTGDAVVTHPTHSYAFGTSIFMQENNVFEPLLYKKHARLYRKYTYSPVLSIFYTIGICLAMMVYAFVFQVPWLGIAAFFTWSALTGYFISERLKNTSHDPKDVWEVIVTSVLIPPAAIYWRIVGALRFHVLFI